MLTAGMLPGTGDDAGGGVGNGVGNGVGRKWQGNKADAAKA